MGKTLLILAYPECQSPPSDPQEGATHAFQDLYFSHMVNDWQAGNGRPGLWGSAPSGQVNGTGQSAPDVELWLSLWSVPPHSLSRLDEV